MEVLDEPAKAELCTGAGRLRPLTLAEACRPVSRTNSRKWICGLRAHSTRGSNRWPRSPDSFRVIVMTLICARAFVLPSRAQTLLQA